MNVSSQSDDTSESDSIFIETEDGIFDWFRHGSSWRGLSWRLLLRIRRWWLGEPDGSDRVIAATDLPAELKTCVGKVVKQTRLWRNEQIAIAHELCDHFADGLDADQSAEQLIEEFGSHSTAAKLMRRGKIRCRPLHWQVWHYGWIGTVCLLVVLTFSWSIMVWRFLSSSTSVTSDLVAQVDDHNRAIRVDQRAWPLYRQGLIRLSVFSSGSNGDYSHNELRSAMGEGPSHQLWPEARRLLATFNESIELFIQAAQKPKLGFINRDPDNEAWTQWQSQSQWNTYNSADKSEGFVWLAQTMDLTLTISSVLKGAIHLAIEDEQRDRAAILAIALLGMAEHIRQDLEFYDMDQMTIDDLSTSLGTIRTLVLHHPELLSDSDLNRLRTKVENAFGGEPIAYRSKHHQKWYGEFFQYIYSDDGSGSGRITSEGLGRLLSQHPKGWSKSGIINYAEAVHIPRWPADGTSWSDNMLSLTVSSAAAMAIADRKTMLKKANQLHRLRIEMIADIDTLPVDSAYVKEWTRIGEHEPVRFLPLTTGYPYVVDQVIETSPARKQVAVNIERDATALTISLEQYRRREGKWPQTLTELDAERLPIDRFSTDNSPLIYRVVDGQPILYSVGPNHVDDNGKSPPDPTEGWKADQGDWHLAEAR